MNEAMKSVEPVLRAQLFGSFRLSMPDGQEVEITGKRARAVLAILCLAPGVAVERGRLCELLWRGRFRAQARASLRQTLLGLKKQLAPMRPGFFEVSRSSVAVNRSAVCSDLAELESALARGQPSQASEILLAIGGKPLLDRLSFGDAFDQWLADFRAQIDQRLKHAAEAALADLQRGGDDPEHTRLLEAWQLRFPATTASDADTRLRIGILPFRANDADAASGPIVQGLFDELVTTLGQVPQLLVAGRRSALNLARSDTSLTDLAEALRVAYLVQGSVRRDEEEVRIHVSLVDGRTGFETWSNRYRGTNGSVFALQDDIARAIARELGTELGMDIHLPGQRRTTSSKVAYELYLQGRALTARVIGDGVLGKAVELLEASLEIDPDFAACWTALAEAYLYTAVYTPCLDRLEKSARMAECAEKAIELEPTQGHARAMLGIHHWTLNDPVGALDLAHEAYRLEPDNPDVALRLGSFLLYIGRTRDALPYIEQAINLNPVDGRSFAILSVAQLNLGNLDEAIAAGQRMVDLGLPAMWLAVATAAAGDYKLAVEQYRQTRLLMNTVIFPPAGTKPLSGPALNLYWQIAARGVCSGRTIHRKLYCTLLNPLHKSLPDPGDTSIVAPAVWMGYAEMVFKTLGTQITPANMICLMSLWADIDPIRQVRLHPEFLPFAERIGLVAAWEKYGWPDLLASQDSRTSQS